MSTLVVAKRFCGPPTSANGGYFSGLVASCAASTVSVRLHSPPPLDTELTVSNSPEGAIEVRHADTLIATAAAAQLSVVPPQSPSYLEALELSRHYMGFENHRFPTCFVCGTQRARGDGLRIFAGRAPGAELVAAAWVADETLDRGDGRVRAEFMSAALDCPGYYAVTPDDRMMLLGEFTMHLDRLIHVGESCTVIGWRISSSGRKHEAGTALFDEDGELCARARALWIEPRAVSA